MISWEPQPPPSPDRRRHIDRSTEPSRIGYITLLILLYIALFHAIETDKVPTPERQESCQHSR